MYLNIYRPTISKNPSPKREIYRNVYKNMFIQIKSL